MEKFLVTVKKGSSVILTETIEAEDERDVLGTLLLSSELFNQSFTDIRILKQ